MPSPRPLLEAGSGGTEPMGRAHPRVGAQAPLAPARQLTPQADEGDGLTTRTKIQPRRAGRRSAVGAAIAGLAIAATPALADSGGTGVKPTPATTPGARAKLVNGFAVPPKQAPQRVVEVI